MSMIYESSEWLTTQARTLEKEILKAKGSSLSYSSIERRLKVGALIELRDCDDRGCMMVLDEDQYEKNKRSILAESGL